ncbi:hypothetical protein FISHEDRAFT_69338 [Fistulina hepatica ATCC 64428]|uniref:Uncharacterized protein n=1 Tax=Fistulina hepatica ATCC 64428 TaxID=1128425 RepID=A0A0D7AQ08_9AGAR|nr:hypothetical protein FISHEDRAFT_69338 [Fistulina hepatica ATCC 64428]
MAAERAVNVAVSSSPTPTDNPPASSVFSVTGYLSNNFLAPSHRNLNDSKDALHPERYTNEASRSTLPPRPRYPSRINLLTHLGQPQRHNKSPRKSKSTHTSASPFTRKSPFSKVPVPSMVKPASPPSLTGLSYLRDVHRTVARHPHLTMARDGMPEPATIEPSNLFSRRISLQIQYDTRTTWWERRLVNHVPFSRRVRFVDGNSDQLPEDRDDDAFKQTDRDSDEHSTTVSEGIGIRTRDNAFYNPRSTLEAGFDSLGSAYVALPHRMAAPLLLPSTRFPSAADGESLHADTSLSNHHLLPSSVHVERLRSDSFGYKGISFQRKQDDMNTNVLTIAFGEFVDVCERNGEIPAALSGALDEHAPHQSLLEERSLEYLLKDVCPFSLSSADDFSTGRSSSRSLLLFDFPSFMSGELSLWSWPIHATPLRLCYSDSYVMTLCYIEPDYLSSGVYLSGPGPSGLLAKSASGNPSMLADSSEMLAKGFSSLPGTPSELSKKSTAAPDKPFMTLVESTKASEGPALPASTSMQSYGSVPVLCDSRTYGSFLTSVSQWSWDFHPTAVALADENSDDQVLSYEEDVSRDENMRHEQNVLDISHVYRSEQESHDLLRAPVSSQWYMADDSWMLSAPPSEDRFSALEPSPSAAEFLRRPDDTGEEENSASVWSHFGQPGEEDVDDAYDGDIFEEGEEEEGEREDSVDNNDYEDPDVASAGQKRILSIASFLSIDLDDPQWLYTSASQGSVAWRELSTEDDDGEFVLFCLLCTTFFSDSDSDNDKSPIPARLIDDAFSCQSPYVDSPGSSHSYFVSTATGDVEDEDVIELAVALASCSLEITDVETTEVVPATSSNGNMPQDVSGHLDFPKTSPHVFGKESAAHAVATSHDADVEGLKAVVDDLESGEQIVLRPRPPLPRRIYLMTPKFRFGGIAACGHEQNRSPAQDTRGLTNRGHASTSETQSFTNEVPLLLGRRTSYSPQPVCEHSLCCQLIQLPITSERSLVSPELPLHTPSLHRELAPVAPVLASATCFVLPSFPTSHIPLYTTRVLPSRHTEPVRFSPYAFARKIRLVVQVESSNEKANGKGGDGKKGVHDEGEDTADGKERVDRQNIGDHALPVALFDTVLFVLAVYTILHLLWRLAR